MTSIDWGNGTSHLYFGTRRDSERWTLYYPTGHKELAFKVSIMSKYKYTDKRVTTKIQQQLGLLGVPCSVKGVDASHDSRDLIWRYEAELVAQSEDSST